MRPLLLFLAVLAPAAAAAAETDLLAAYTQLREIPLDPTRAAVVENFELKKDAATFHFKSGTLYLFKPVLDRPAGAVFLGEGVLSFKPPAVIEQRQIAHFLNGESGLEEPFKEAVLLFTDVTLDQIQALKFRAAEIPPRASSLLGDLRSAWRNDLHTNLEARLLAGLTSPVQSYFLADIRGQKHGRLFFSIDAAAGEDVTLMHDGGSKWSFEIWSSYTAAETPTAEFRALADSTRISIDTEIDKGGRIQGESTSEFTALESGPRLVPVQLASTLRVSKITDAAGAELKFIQEQKKKDADLWVVLTQPLAKDAKHTWKFAYAGDEVVHKAGGGNFFVGARDSWYPKISNPADSFNDRALYHLRFRTPKEVTLVATGKLVKTEPQGKLTASEWDTEVPYTVVGFNYGRYKTKSTRSGDREVTVYANAEIGDEMRELQILLEQNPQAAAQLGITSGGINTTGIMNQTLAESGNALNLFTSYFGPIPYKSLAVTQQPAGFFGQSWPGLVFMPYTAFLDNTIRHQLHMDQGGMRKFFQEVGSHEIAHQWWGHAVGWKNYHDQWLSEGFAQFSAGLYVHRVQGEKKFRTFLETDRQLVLSSLPGTTVRARDAGPIWMGLRLDTEKTPAAYQYLIYAKGGLVLHMLRMMLYDYGRNDDSRFIAMMKDFVETYANRNASTEDFKAICDKHFKMDMGWFFRQWVYGTDLPKILVEYSFADSPEGVLWKVDLKQQNVPEGFISMVPFVLRTKAGGLAGRLSAQHSTLHAELKLKERPDSVEINPLYGWLCELEVKKK